MGSLVEKHGQEYLNKKLRLLLWFFTAIDMPLNARRQTVEFCLAFQSVYIDKLLALEIVKQIVASFAKNPKIVNGAINKVSVTNMMNVEFGNSGTQHTISANGECLTAKALPMVGLYVFEIRLKSSRGLRQSFAFGTHKGFDRARKTRNQRGLDAKAEA